MSWRKLSPFHWLWLAFAGVAVVAAWMWRRARVAEQKAHVELRLREVHDRHATEMQKARTKSRIVQEAVRLEYEDEVKRLNKRREKINEAAVEGGPALEELWANVMKRRYAKKDDQ